MMDPQTNHKKFNKRKVWNRALSAALGFLIFGYSLYVFNSSQTCVSSVLGWGDDSEFYIALMTAVSPFGSLFGAVCTGYLTKYYGKRSLLIYSDCITIIGSAINYYPNTITFGIGRLILGFAVGSFSILTPQYISEFTPPNEYSKMGMLSSLNALFGILIANLACQLLPENGCSPENKFLIFILFTFPLIVAVLQLIIFLKVYKKESPAWLIRSNQLELMYKSNESIFGTSYAENELEKMQKLIEKGQKTQITKEETFCELITCKSGTTKGMRVGLMVHLYQQLSGINCIIMYSTLLFMDIGEGLFLARMLTSLSTFTRILTVILMLPVVGKFNTKWIFILGHLFMGLNLLMISFYYDDPSLKYVAIGNIFIYSIAFGGSLGPLCWSYSSQVMPDKGMALGTGVNWTACTVTVLFFPLLIDTVGLGGAFMIYAVFNFSAVIYFYFDMIDIKGKSRQEIREIFSKHR